MRCCDFHQVFRHEKGTLRDRWEGSDLEVKVEEIEKCYRQETDRICSKISILREERRKLDEELEVGVQKSLMGDIHYQTMSAEERAEQAESIKSELKVKTNDRLLDQATTSIAAVQYQELLQRAKSIEEEIGRIEWRELYPIKQQFDELMKRIELAKYKSFPWGGLCIDEKGLFWQTLVPIARHYKREHHLMLLQTRPNWAPPEWKPQARFNVLSDRKIKTSTYAKAIVDTAGSIAGGHEESPFLLFRCFLWPSFGVS